MSPRHVTTFINCRQCINGELVEDQLVVSGDTALIEKSTGEAGGRTVDLEGGIIAPGFLELHTNGVHGFHYTHFDDSESYRQKLEHISKYYVSQGITGFWATIPTVTAGQFQKIIPNLSPWEFSAGASLLGAHCEGPYLHPSKKGAHNASLFLDPSQSPESTYGEPNLSNIKLVTLAPELPQSSALIQNLSSRGIRVSLGHSNATYAQGVEGLKAGATGLTHVLNAMSALHHRDPGLPGLVGLPLSTVSSHPPATPGTEPPYYSIIPDGHHIHPNVVSLLARSGPQKAILITDSIELLGLPDGTYPGHAQIPFNQTKMGTKVVIEGTDTLIGGCCSLQEGVRNLMKWSGCDVAQAVRCVTENVASFMSLEDRGKLEEGRRADFVVLDDDGNLRETWVAGKKVWEKSQTV
ncbi:Metallo-dependent hydrolase [Rhizodiscina lignyota]|uniref:N-acetylglucosamine-6-phosphate deacetylase n=1 Tax=Rhizodiscina lignyota TaxID=1504668 RepID=A0A9P4IIS2_9PEZI|nr:Metallo-dependent hydrolase [Rhizodiscina lignyota]